MDPTVPQANELLTFTGLSVVTIVVFEVIKRALALTPELLNRVGPLISVGVAVILALVAVVVISDDGLNDAAILQAVLTGIIAGAAASGIYGMTSRNPAG